VIKIKFTLVIGPDMLSLPVDDESGLAPLVDGLALKGVMF